MDAFNLRWPGGDATLHTDGVRCRVVWRGANGMGGTIENSEQAKRRVAAGLGFAPGLLDELKEAGHVDLAAELERIAPPAPDAATASEPNAPRPKPAASAPPPSAKPTQSRSPPPPRKTRIERWLESVPGPIAFEACGVRRAAKWHHGKTWPDGLSLKTPLAGKGDWVLKIAGDETRYFAAEGFGGICAALAAQKDIATDESIEGFLEGCKALRHKDVQLARDAWDAVRGS